MFVYLYYNSKPNKMKNLFTHWSTKDLEEYAEYLIQKNVCTDERLYKTVIRVDKELQRRGIN